MNLVVITGVIIGTPTLLKNVKGERLTCFKVGAMDDITGNPVYVNCMADRTVGFNIYTKAKEGDPVTIRGSLNYNRAKGSNYVCCSFVEFLRKTPIDTNVHLDLKEFLEIYEPSKVLENYKKLEKEQEELRKQKELEGLDKCQSMFQEQETLK